MSSAGKTFLFRVIDHLGTSNTSTGSARWVRTFSSIALLVIFVVLDFVKAGFLRDLASLVALGRGSWATLGRSLLGWLVVIIIIAALFLLVIFEVRGLDLVVVGFFDTFVIVDLFRLRCLALLGLGLCWAISG